MRRNCNLELRLLPFSDSDHLHHQDRSENENSESPQQKQQLTIFYDGRVCVCDVTELQARAILLLANRGMEEKLKSPIIATPPATATTVAGERVCSSPTVACQPIPAPGLSMKRSIQRFLQKRNHRIQATYPYNN